MVRIFLIGIGIIVAVYAWPYLSSSKHAADHVIAAIDYHNKAAALANKTPSPSITVMSKSDWDAITDYNKKALGEAEQADIADMNRHYPGFGDHFRDEFIEGLRLIINNDQGMTQAAPYLYGQLLVNNFGEWYIANFDAVRGKKR